jgi:hypothetical protein
MLATKMGTAKRAEINMAKSVDSVKKSPKKSFFFKKKI